MIERHQLTQRCLWRSWKVNVKRLLFGEIRVKWSWGRKRGARGEKQGAIYNLSTQILS